MSEQVGWRGLLKSFKQEAPYLARSIPQLPRLVHQSLTRPAASDPQPQIERLIAAQHQQNRWLAMIALLLALIVSALFN
jgi:ubiquinone biosynthesis protein